MDGLKFHLEKIAAGEEDDNVETLNQIPPRGIFSRLVRWIIPALILAMIVFGIYKLGLSSIFSAVILPLVLWNGGLAALGTLLALGHTLSVLVSLIGAPLVAVNPLVGVGLLSGLTQVTMRKPRVTDAETINDDIGSLGGLYRNRISHALIVFFLSSIGAMVGKFIAIPSIVGQLFR
jgi:pheromone shutdown protein TraB